MPFKIKNTPRRLKQAFSKWSKKESRVGPLIACNTLGKPVWTPRNYESLSFEGYMKNIIIYRCVTLVSRGAASVPWRLLKRNTQITRHPLLQLLHHPNPRQGGASFIEMVLSHKLLSGNSYIEAVDGARGQPFELYALRPDRVRIVPGSGGVPIGYEYTVNGQSRRIGVDLLNGNSPILHLKTFHPLNDWYGMSPVEAAACAVDQHNAVSNHNLAMLQNGGRPSGALKVYSRSGANPPRLTAEQRQNMRDNLREAYQGATNAGKVLLLEGDVEWKEMGHKLKDMDFVAGKLLSAREICQAYGVPPMLVGVPGDATFSNYRESRYHLWEDTVLPLLDHLCDELNHWLLPKFDKDLRLECNVDSIPALAPRRENSWQRIEKSSFLTDEEKRQLLGFPPLAASQTQSGPTQSGQTKESNHAPSNQN
ncbi:MAG: phage portal protein [Pseudomonadota bacterium]